MDYTAVIHIYYKQESVNGIFGGIYTLYPSKPD